jgi:DNA-directed RNA polymerase subunit RPC12/RpoP
MKIDRARTDDIQCANCGYVYEYHYYAPDGLIEYPAEVEATLDKGCPDCGKPWETNKEEI